MTHYLIIISVITAIITVYDKIAAKAFTKHRVPEKVLLFLAVIGGAAAEYITMKIIRHKTKHTKFMIGLPVIMAVHIIVFLAVYHFYF